MKCLPLEPEVPHQRTEEAWNPVELAQVDRVPGNDRVILQGRFALLPQRVHRSVNLLEFAPCRILHDLRPGMIRLTQGQRICVTRSAVAPESFFGSFRHVRPPMTTGMPAARMASATRYALAIMRVMAPMPTSPICWSRAN